MTNEANKTLLVHRNLNMQVVCTVRPEGRKNLFPAVSLLGTKRMQKEGISAGKTNRDSNRLPGVLFTVSNPSKLRQASSALLALLQVHCTEMNACEGQDESADHQQQNVSDQIASELAELSKQKHLLRFSGELSRGIGLIGTIKGIKPSVLVHRLFTGPLPVVPPLFVSRVCPIDWVCAPNLKSFKAVMTPVIKNKFEGFTEDVTWKIQLDTHGLTDIKKDVLVTLLNDVIQSRHEVSIHEPEVSIIIQVTTQVCGVSLVRDFDAFEGYNLRKVILNRSQNPDS